jgi:hypothetical protein
MWQSMVLLLLLPGSLGLIKLLLVDEEQQQQQQQQQQQRPTAAVSSCTHQHWPLSSEP